MDFSKGTRVRVQIKKPDDYATGAAECLNECTGFIEEVKSLNRMYLVRFDKPCRTWWANQTPPTAWHFTSNELIAL